MTPQDALLRAVDVIHERGWTRYDLVDQEGRVCVLGAIGVALWGSARMPYFFGKSLATEIVRCQAETLVNSELRARNAGKPLLLSCWNDSIAVDADEVCDVLKRAAERTC